MKDNQKETNAADAKGNGKNLSPYYEVVLCKSQEYYCHLPVPAKSEREAMRHAFMWAPLLNLDWRLGFTQVSPRRATKIETKKKF